MYSIGYVQFSSWKIICQSQRFLTSWRAYVNLKPSKINHNYAGILVFIISVWFFGRALACNCSEFCVIFLNVSKIGVTPPLRRKSSAHINFPSSPFLFCIPLMSHLRNLHEQNCRQPNNPRTIAITPRPTTVLHCFVLLWRTSVVYCIVSCFLFQRAQ